MSKYTTELRFICETFAGLSESTGFSNIEDVLDKSWDKVFNFTTDRPSEEQCKKILRHYYTREICAETVGRWQLFLQATCSEVMPKYNALYAAQIKEIDPFWNKHYSREGNTSDKTDSINKRTDNTVSATTGSHGTTTKNTQTNNLTRTDKLTRTDNLKTTSKNTETRNLTGTGTSSGKDKRGQSDTPQGSLADIETGNYLTSGSVVTTTGNTSSTDKGTVGNNGIVNNSGTVKNTGTVTDTGTVKDEGSVTVTIADTVKNTGDVTNLGSDEKKGKFNENIEGFDGKYFYEMLAEYADKFVNIDKLLIEEFKDLFYVLY